MQTLFDGSIFNSYVRSIMATIRNLNHPKKGSLTKVEPIRDLAAIEHIKAELSERPRDLCLFVLGINTAFRAGELLSIRCGQVAHLNEGDQLELMQNSNLKVQIFHLRSCNLI